MVKYALIYNSDIVIGDSYRISNIWVDRIKKWNECCSYRRFKIE